MVAFLASLLATLVLEVGVLSLLVMRFQNGNVLPLGRLIAAGVLASSATLPYVWFVIPGMFATPNNMYLGEGFAVIAEGEIYRLTLGLSRPRSLAYSFACNAVSYLAGPWVAMGLAKLGVSPY
jgi:hypothetical protein